MSYVVLRERCNFKLVSYVWQKQKQNSKCNLTELKNII